MPRCAAYNCSNSCKNMLDKSFFIFPKNECTRKAWITAINRKERTLPKNVYLCFFMIAYPGLLIPRKISCPKKFLVTRLFLVTVKYV